MLRFAGKVADGIHSMNAWGNILDKDGSSGIRFVADPSGAFTHAFDTEAAPLLGTNRSKRYAVVIDNGKVKSVHIEPDNVGTEVSTADKILG